MISSYDNFESFIQDKYTLIPAAIILGISAVLFFFGMLGCCSTIRESKAGLTVVRLCVFFFAYLFTLKHSPHRPNGPLSHLPLFASPVLHGHRGDLCCRGVRLGVWLRLPQQGGFPVARRSLLICGLCRPGSKLEHLSLRVCPVKLRPGTLHDGRLRKVRRGGRRQQSRGVSADPGRCRSWCSFTEIPLLAFRFRSPLQLLLLHPPAPPFTFISLFSTRCSFNGKGQL